MDKVFIGKKGEYDWTWDALSPFVYLPELDAVLITRFFIVWKTPDEQVPNNSMVILSHESIHEAICKMVGAGESKAFDNVPYFNKAIEDYLRLNYAV